MKRPLLALCLCLFSLTAGAYTFDGTEIRIPPGFEGPITRSMGHEARAIAFVHRHPGDDVQTLLQITILTPDLAFPDLSEKQLREGAAAYTRRMLSGVERRRTHYHQDPVTYLAIDGIPAARIAWHGELRGRPFQGAMTCYIHDSRVICLHTQDAADYHGEYTRQVEQAFEGISRRR